MNIKRWIERRETSWRTLEQRLAQVEKQGLRRLSSAQVKELASLYRSVSADLARARSVQVGPTLISDLQTLTTRAYSQIYQGAKREDWRNLVTFYRRGLPAALRAAGGYIALATAIFLAGAVIGWWFSWQDPRFLRLLVPESLISLVQDEGQLWMGSILGTEPMASSTIMVNNITVAFKTVAGGMTLGLLTVYILFFNGLLIGAIATLVGQNNLAIPFWAFVFPHGSLELPAIFIAGGAGLLLARGLLLPGRYGRRDALRLRGLQAAQLVYGLFPMLVMAGIIEGFLSPSPIVPDFLKYLIGTALLGGLFTYCRNQ
ncbi:MAG: stage II sporulation protein M [Prochlorothrix sp.]|nr:stage II sporulation protein M [Prochlorothrix sp.]